MANNGYLLGSIKVWNIRFTQWPQGHYTDIVGIIYTFCLCTEEVSLERIGIQNNQQYFRKRFQLRWTVCLGLLSKYMDLWVHQSG